jgi:hypothetical protein
MGAAMTGEARSPATPRPDDPRIALGLTVEPHVVGPFSVRGATRTSPDEGGTLDCGLLGYVTGGRPVVFGEIWAACPSGTNGKVRLDARAVAERIVSLLNAYDPEALKPEAFGDPAGPEWQRGELLPPEAGERLCEFACCGLRLSSSHHDTANPATCPDCKPATDPEALARLTAENARLRAALENVQMTVAYIVTHATLARATREIEEGPRVQSPTVAEVWELIGKMGDTARAALAGTP